ncbi:hypothetical protein BGX38DRAFT_521621 [Terfezia claveryi]|nr:hypothetical protein BGX38DRAFT_521621 [Terfezia claveryi]
MAWLRGQSERGLTHLAQTFTAAMRQWLAAGRRTAVRLQAVTNPASRSTTTRGLVSVLVVKVWASLTSHCCSYCTILSGMLGGPLQQTVPTIEAFLRVFAGPTVVRNLEQKLLHGLGLLNQINRVENYCHQYFGSEHFVLEPVGDPLARIQLSTDVLSSYAIRFSWLTENRQERAKGVGTTPKKTLGPDASARSGCFHVRGP